ncbi:MAG: MarR family transcriptional regulator, partial [Tumebacillaceae bacterium]
MNVHTNDDEFRAYLVRMLIRINNVIIKHGNSNRLAGAFGLSQQQWTLLGVLHRNGQGMTMTELGKNLLVTKANMTGMIDRLERDGYVSRHPDQFDRRVTKVMLTEKGNEFMQSIEKPRNEFYGEMFQDFTDEEMV